MEKTVDFSKTVYELCSENPEITEIMREIGFKEITNPAMLKTAGRIMTIPKGAMMRGISLDTIKEAFVGRGYTVKE